MKRFHLMIADLWQKCNGNPTLLTDEEWEAFSEYMWDHVEYVDRLRAMDEALKTWAKEQEGKR